MTAAPSTPLGHRRRAACRHCRTPCVSCMVDSIDWDDEDQRCPIARWPAPHDGRPAPDLPATRDLRSEVRRYDALLRGDRPTGPALWRELHETALRHELSPEFMAEFNFRVSLLGTCGCSQHWATVLQEHPVRWDDQFAWSVAAHNEVNRRLGKPEISIADAKVLHTPRTSPA